MKMHPVINTLFAKESKQIVPDQTAPTGFCLCMLFLSELFGSGGQRVRESFHLTWRHSAVVNVSNCSCVSDCRSRGCEFDSARSYTFMEIDHKIISSAILLPSAVSRRVVVSYKRTGNRLVKLAQEKSVIG